MNKKEFYASPEAELFEVRFEGVVCQSPNYGSKGQAGGDPGLNDGNYNYGGF